jgi:hypothetical protein
MWKKLNVETLEFGGESMWHEKLEFGWVRTYVLLFQE